jgi:hypothetical protein
VHSSTSTTGSTVNGGEAYAAMTPWNIGALELADAELQQP